MRRTSRFQPRMAAGRYRPALAAVILVVGIGGAANHSDAAVTPALLGLNGQDDQSVVRVDPVSGTATTVATVPGVPYVGAGQSAFDPATGTYYFFGSTPTFQVVLSAVDVRTGAIRQTPAAMIVNVEIEPTDRVAPPTTRDDCRNGGWRTFTNPTFRNQGECMRYVNQGG